MKKIMRWRYYCEYCKKSGASNRAEKAEAAYGELVTRLAKVEAENANLKGQISVLNDDKKIYEECISEVRAQTAEEIYKMVCEDKYVFGAKNLIAAIRNKYKVEVAG